MRVCAVPGDAGDGDPLSQPSARSSTGTRAVEFTAACGNRRQTSGWWRKEQRSTTNGSGQHHYCGLKKEPAARVDAPTPPPKQRVGSAEAQAVFISGAKRP